MELFFGVPHIDSFPKPQNMPQPLGKTANVLPQSLCLADQIALTFLMPSSPRQIEAARIFVSRRLPPPTRSNTPARDERRRGEFIRRVLVAKSEASGQNGSRR